MSVTATKEVNEFWFNEPLPCAPKGRLASGELIAIVSHYLIMFPGAREAKRRSVLEREQVVL